MQIKAAVPKMDLKSKAIGPDYVKNLIFSKKELSILKLIQLLNSSEINDELKLIFLKILPVFFSFAELNGLCFPECLTLIAKIKRHPSFTQEKSLFDGWQFRLKNLISSPEVMIKNVESDVKSTEKFVFIPGTNMCDIIGYAELDLFFRFNKWLKYHKLHKYLYFFANLSYVEIQNITANNIRSFETKVGLHPMTDGARNAILRKLAELNQRSARLEIFNKKEYYTGVSKVEKSIHEIRMILRTPIRKNQVFSNTNSNLPDLISNAIETVVFMILRLPKDEFMKVYEPVVSLLKMAWGCSFFENEVKKKFNVFQAALHPKGRSYSRRKIISTKDVRNNCIYIDQKDICALQFDVENGIRDITSYLENVVLKDI